MTTSNAALLPVWVPDEGGLWTPVNVWLQFKKSVQAADGGGFGGIVGVGALAVAARKLPHLPALAIRGSLGHITIAPARCRADETDDSVNATPTMAEVTPFDRHSNAPRRS